MTDENETPKKKWSAAKKKATATLILTTAGGGGLLIHGGYKLVEGTAQVETSAPGSPERMQGIKNEAQGLIEGTLVNSVSLAGLAALKRKKKKEEERSSDRTRS